MKDTLKFKLQLNDEKITLRPFSEEPESPTLFEVMEAFGQAMRGFGFLTNGIYFLPHDVLNEFKEKHPEAYEFLEREGNIEI